MTSVDTARSLLYFSHTHTHMQAALSHTSYGNHDNLAASASSSPTLAPSISFSPSLCFYTLSFVVFVEERGDREHLSVSLCFISIFFFPDTQTFCPFLPPFRSVFLPRHRSKSCLYPVRFLTTVSDVTPFFRSTSNFIFLSLCIFLVYFSPSLILTYSTSLSPPSHILLVPLWKLRSFDLLRNRVMAGWVWEETLRLICQSEGVSVWLD